MDLLFYIIFIPHSVKYLRFAPLSLLPNCSYRFCLVSNGLKPTEHALLEQLVRSNDRLTLYGEPDGKLKPHGAMLNVLLKQDTSDWFCFMDNDIFAAGPFQHEIEDRLANCDVFSSAYPLSIDPQSAVPGYMGMCLRTPGGLSLAPTYLSAYRRSKLVDLIEDTGVGFEHYAPAESLPDVAKQPDFPEDLTGAHKLDSGKLMNILASARQWRFCFHDIPELVHVGNLASAMERSQKWSKRLRALFTGKSKSGVYRLHERDMEAEVEKRIRRRRRRHGCDNFASAADEREYVRIKIMRNRFASYFRFLFEALVDGGPMPQIELPPGELTNRLERASKVLKDVVSESTGT